MASRLYSVKRCARLSALPWQNATAKQSWFAPGDWSATLRAVMRLPGFHVLRALAALAIAFASPGVELSHGFAHVHDHDSHQSQTASHHDDAAVVARDHSPDHGHQELSEALRIRADFPDFISVEAAQAVADLSNLATGLSFPVSDPKLFADRATGPPPRLRAPPID
jgi:hypothetical protein